MFPDTLDNAKVLYYTPKGNYGDLFYDNGTIAAHFVYMAICKYEKTEGFYLFLCNEDFEVETDELYDSVNPEIRSLRKLLTEIRQNRSDELPLIRQAAVLGAFIKRRSNLSILAHNSPEIDMKELEYSLRESMYYLSLAGIKCSVMMDGKGKVSAEKLIRMRR